ncbi:MAG: hypothetical protein A2Z06_02690 [Candidatus Glassbacteria bacterium RBG_16_58_8]|uniref:Cytochrome b/b6 C-terminal region profile domain-containing protein n=1 Tax=Candidatus Glassbacteria bacterium RBG_16_58_8 TaxID=1817866 RepID=A0A1F5YCV7_9BACT|nr:MAG: hypothetical protein A2Z06_02690 [Candidatus Glassbacteria bacterium RBG_16_58_8]
MRARREQILFTARVLRLAILTYLALGLILTLSILKPLPLMEEADPFRPIAVEPDWYLRAAKVALSTLPGPLSALAILLIPILFLALPWIERAGWLSGVSSRIRVVLAIILTAGFMLLTWGLGC